jgi:hypothetical protein
MKPHPRIRTAIKWSGAVVTVLLVGVWIGSGWFVLGNRAATFRWNGIHHGLLVWSWQSSRGWQGPGITLYTYPQVGWEIETTAYSLRWTPQYDGYNLDRWVLLPLWILVVPAAAITGTAWRLDTLARRRAKRNFCPKCEYDRTGLTTGVICPECGSSPE